MLGKDTFLSFFPNYAVFSHDKIEKKYMVVIMGENIIFKSIVMILVKVQAMHRLDVGDHPYQM